MFNNPILLTFIQLIKPQDSEHVLITHLVVLKKNYKNQINFEIK